MLACFVVEQRNDFSVRGKGFISADVDRGKLGGKRSEGNGVNYEVCAIGKPGNTLCGPMKCLVSEADEIPAEGAGRARRHGPIRVDGNGVAEVREAEGAPLLFFALAN